jgi:hypothetical protein
MTFYSGRPETSIELIILPADGRGYVAARFDNDRASVATSNSNDHSVEILPTAAAGGAALPFHGQGGRS